MREVRSPNLSNDAHHDENDYRRRRRRVRSHSYSNEDDNIDVPMIPSWQHNQSSSGPFRRAAPSQPQVRDSFSSSRTNQNGSSASSISTPTRRWRLSHNHPIKHPIYGQKRPKPFNRPLLIYPLFIIVPFFMYIFFTSNRLSPPFSFERRLNNYSIQYSFLSARKNMQIRATTRRERVIPPRQRLPPPPTTYSFHGHRDPSQIKSDPASSICGVFAQAASEARPDDFPSEFALSKKSSVLITGILSPLGFNLALKLHSECGVTDIYGIDPILPNTIMNRLENLKRIQILSNKISGLSNIYVSYGGVNPKGKVMDVVDKFKPTHIVHLMGGDGIYDGRTMKIWQNGVSMDQIFGSLNKHKKMKVNMLYLSSQKDGLFGVVKLMDELLAGTYRRLGVQSVGLRFNAELYGPWGRDGDKAPQMAEAAIKDREVELSGNFLYTNDVVDAVIVAMQYRQSGDYEPIFDIGKGSKFTFGDVANTWKNPEFKLESSPPENSVSIQKTRDILHWNPRTSPQWGIKNLLAWHAHKHHVFESVSPIVPLPKIHRPLLCASECSMPTYCTPSIFDPIIPLTHEITSSCDIVLYTLANNERSKSFGMKTTEPDPHDPMKVCNLAFIPQNALYLPSVLSSEPLSSLELQNRLLNDNGKVVHHGFTLIWLSTPAATHIESYLLKLSPSKIFSPNVKYAMYVDSKLKVAPLTDDVLFLVSEMERDAQPSRTVHLKEEYRDVKIPSDPARRAVILVSPLVLQDSKISVSEATSILVKDLKLNERKQLETQRDFYSRVPTFINRDDLRSPMEPIYRFKMSVYARTRWVLHDMRLEEAKELRCDWFKEHLIWANELDEISLAYVMARREMERKIRRREPDDHEHTESEGEAMSDKTEWVPVLRKEEYEGSKSREVGLYVRVMSNKSMVNARRKWGQRKQELILKKQGIGIMESDKQITNDDDAQEIEQATQM